jgi:hypothetical protein
MNLFRKRQATTDAPVATERNCRGCGATLADDQLACLTCGAVDEPAGGRERRWLLPTGGVVGVALFLVTSASFAATTALRTGDPTAIKQDPPQVAQAAPAIPPASGDGTVPNQAEDGKGPDLGAGGDAAAPPAGGDDTPADDGADSDSGSGSSGGSDGDSGSSGGGSGSSGGSGGSDEPDDKPAPAKISEWPAGQEGYTVVVYTFNAKSEAKAKAREVAADGHPAGVLNSSNFASLEPGSWLVYIGEYDSAKEAERAAATHDGDYPGEVTYVGDKQSPEYEEPQTDSASGSSTTP